MIQADRAKSALVEPKLLLLIHTDQGGCSSTMRLCGTQSNIVDNRNVLKYDVDSPGQLEDQNLIVFDPVCGQIYIRLHKRIVPKDGKRAVAEYLPR